MSTLGYTWGLTGQVGVNYSSRMIEVRQTAKFKNWLLALKDRRAADRIAIRIARLETGNFGDTEFARRWA